MFPYLDWVSNVLPGGNEGHANEENNEGGAVVELERKVVDRGRIRLPLGESESEFHDFMQERKRESTVEKGVTYLR